MGPAPSLSHNVSLRLGLVISAFQIITYHRGSAHSPHPLSLLISVSQAHPSPAIYFSDTFFMVADAGSAWSSPLSDHHPINAAQPAHPSPSACSSQSPRLSPTLVSIFVTVSYDPTLKHDVLTFPVLVVH